MQENNQKNDTPNTTTDSDNIVTPTVDTTAQDINEVSLPVMSAPVISMSEAVIDPVVTATTVVAAETETPPVLLAAPVAKKQVLLQYGIATVVVLIMGAGLTYALEQQGRIQTGIFDKISSIVNPAPAAAIVNGTKISKADYDKNLIQLQTTAKTQGADIASEAVQTEIKKQAIDVLINTELLRQEARKEGADVTEEQIEARYQEIIKSIGGEDKLKEKMTELNITEPALRKDIEGEILIQGHLSKAVDTSKIIVSEKELADAYAQIKATQAAGVTVPPLTEIKAQLETQLKTNKEQELVNTYITKIREGAKIEILI